MRIGFIKGVFGDIPHAVVTENENGISIKGLTSFGKTLANEIVDTKDSLGDELPVGLMFTGFYEPTGYFSDELDNSEIESSKTNIKPRIDKKILRHKNNIKVSSKSNILFSPISTHGSPITKPRAISFKARAFIVNSKRTSFGQKIKAGQFILNSATSTIRPIREAQFSSQHVEEAISKYGRGFIRKSLSILSAEQVAGTGRRVNRRAKSLTKTTADTSNAPQLRFVKAVIGR